MPRLECRARLPEGFHGDPADRMIIATAHSLGAVVATADTRILNYAKKHYLKALAC